MWKILTAASTALVLTGTSALADFATWDVDADDRVTYEEFGAGFDNNIGMYPNWDTDGDGLLSQTEVQTTFGDFAGYDATFGEDDNNVAMYPNWDTDGDGLLSQDEFGGAIYDTYDADDDDLWSAEEYEAYEQDEWF